MTATILIADDEERILRALGRALRADGHDLILRLHVFVDEPPGFGWTVQLDFFPHKCVVTGLEIDEHLAFVAEQGFAGDSHAGFGIARDGQPRDQCGAGRVGLDTPAWQCARRGRHGRRVTGAQQAAGQRRLAQRGAARRGPLAEATNWPPRAGKRQRRAEDYLPGL